MTSRCKWVESIHKDQDHVHVLHLLRSLIQPLAAYGSNYSEFTTWKFPFPWHLLTYDFMAESSGSGGGVQWVGEYVSMEGVSPACGIQFSRSGDQSLNRQKICSLWCWPWSSEQWRTHRSRRGQKKLKRWSNNHLSTISLLVSIQSKNLWQHSWYSGRQQLEQ